MPMATKFGRVVTCHEGLPPIKPHDPLITWSFEITSQTKTVVSTTRVPVATKLGSKVTYLDGLLSIKSYDPLIMWSCEVTWQTKSIISPLSQCLWPPNVLGW